MIAVIDVEAAAARAELGVAADRLELHLGAVFTGDVEAQPVVPGIAEADAEEERVLDVLLVDAPARRPDEAAIGLLKSNRLELLVADADVAAQIPAAASTTGARTI